MVDSLFSNVEARLLAGRKVSATVWEKLFLKWFNSKGNLQQAKKILLLLAKMGEREPAIWGCVRAVRQLESTYRADLPYLVDVCGTGGDGRQTFNISTVSSFVIAGAGAYVAKHGNRAVSSKTGSSDLMEALGIDLRMSQKRVLASLQRFHLGYFHAPCYHPVFSKAQPLRRELGIRTIFNVVGPLLNPVEVKYQLVGVSDPNLMESMIFVLKRLNRACAATVRSRDGLDELSVAAPSDILYLRAGRIGKGFVNPEKLGFKKAKTQDLAGGDRDTNKEIALRLLENRLRGPCLDAVLLNSGFVLWLVGLSRTLSEGIERARWAIQTGRGYQVLQGLRLLSRKKAV